MSKPVAVPDATNGRAPAPVEAGAVETEMRDDSAPPEPEPQTQPVEPPPPMPTTAELTGPEMAEIKLRNEAVDKANKAAQVAQAEATQAARLAQYGQEALTGLVTMLIGQKGLDPEYRYQIDLDRGRIVNGGRFSPLRSIPPGG